MNVSTVQGGLEKVLVVGLDETACTLQEMGAAPPDECVCSEKKMLIVSDGDVHR